MLKKLSKMIARALGAPAATAGRKHPQPRRFAPAVEDLEGRWVPTTLQVHGLLADSAEAGKVTVQDFHFVKKVDKPSPALMAQSTEAGKVSMQDFHFVSKQDKASPKLFAQSAAAGINISLEDILVSSYHSKASSH